jgi:hypothetical protein
MESNAVRLGFPPNIVTYIAKSCSDKSCKGRAGAESSFSISITAHTDTVLPLL